MMIMITVWYSDIVIVGQLNDMWEFDIMSDSWDHLGGSESIDVSTNWYTPQPGGIEDHAMAIDSDGYIYVFGGYDSGIVIDYMYLYLVSLNHLWKYDKSINEWEYLSGSQYSGVTPQPERVNDHTMVIDNNDGFIYIFGGVRCILLVISHL